MKKCLVIPDSFKGSISSSEICSIVSEEVLKMYPECNVVSLPIADGGVGTVNCIRNALKWDLIEVDTVGPFNDPIKANYVANKIEQTAVIETAQAVGLHLAEGRLNPSIASTYGVGLMIKDAITKGYKNIIVAVGGSCSTDGGAGCAAALGVEFIDFNGNSFIPVGATLNSISKINADKCHELIKNCKISAMCDMYCYMHGPAGTACIYSPQKGADPQMVAMLDKNLEYLDLKFKSELGKNVANINGSGACGGLGATILALFNGHIRSGINHMLDIMNFDEISADADLIITGEGCLDELSLKGKTVYGIAQRVKKLNLNIPVIAIVGQNKLDFKTTSSVGISSVVPVTPTYMRYEEARNHAQNNLKNAVIKMLVSRSLY